MAPKTDGICLTDAELEKLKLDAADQIAPWKAAASEELGELATEHRKVCERLVGKEAEIERLLEELGFYADRETWAVGMRDSGSRASRDGGTRARRALKAEPGGD